MKYVSTRGEAPALAFDDVVLAGLAADGGLYVPEDWPQLSADDLRGMANLDYASLAARLIGPFASPAISEENLYTIAADAYRSFTHPAVAPLRRLRDDLHLLELFHGPTLAFKDYALQILGRLFDHVLSRRGERITIVGATSGDTGSAAIEACRNRDAIEIFVLFPEGRISEVQRRQMTTVEAPNVHTVSVQGTFDDCQALVKGMFNDAAFRRRFRLSAVNSINWARIVAQIVFYVFAALRLGVPERAVSFAVPTGNFGNVFAGYGAHRIGVPIERLIVGSNRNDILTRFFETGRMETQSVVPTLSPSMDIQVSSNFERLLFELYDRDGLSVADLMRTFLTEGRFAVTEGHLGRAAKIFAAARFCDDATTDTIRVVYEDTGIILDPHTAVGVAAAETYKDAGLGPTVALATAHPAKFPEAVTAAIGRPPDVPARLAALRDREERYQVLPAELGAVQDHVSAIVAQRGVAA